MYFSKLETYLNWNVHDQEILFYEEDKLEKSLKYSYGNFKIFYVDILLLH